MDRKIFSKTIKRQVFYLIFLWGKLDVWIIKVDTYTLLSLISMGPFLNYFLENWLSFNSFTNKNWLFLFYDFDNTFNYLDTYHSFSNPNHILCCFSSSSSFVYNLILKLLSTIMKVLCVIVNWNFRIFLKD